MRVDQYRPLNPSPCHFIMDLNCPKSFIFLSCPISLDLDMWQDWSIQSRFFCSHFKVSFFFFKDRLREQTCPCNLHPGSKPVARESRPRLNHPSLQLGIISKCCKVFRLYLFLNKSSILIRRCCVSINI